MAAALYRKRPSPLASGQVRCSWACDIVYVLGQVSSLSAKSIQPVMTMVGKIQIRAGPRRLAVKIPVVH